MRAVRSLSMAAVVGGMVLLSRGGLKTAADEVVPYIGSAKCKICHNMQPTKIYDSWSKTKHALLKPEDADSDGMKHRKVTGCDANGQPIETGVACEACHGPGGAHIKANKETRKTTIVNGARLDPPAKEAMICAQCHAAGKSLPPEPVDDKWKEKDYPDRYKPGDDLKVTFKVEQADKHSKQSIYSEWVNSKHSEKNVGCPKCHDPHGGTDQPHQLKAPVNDLCGGCHEKEKDIKTHQPDAPAAATSCNNCHMPDGVHLFTKEAAKEGMAKVK